MDIPYQTEPLALAGAAGGNVPNQKLIGKVLSVAVISATFQDDVLISFNGASFFLLSFSDSLQFQEPTEVWIGNNNAAANTIVVGSGSAKISRSFSSGGSVTVTGTVATTVTDGADAAVGAKADAAATTDAGTFSLIALIKRLLGKATFASAADLVSGSSAACAGVNGEQSVLAAPGAALRNFVGTLLVTNDSATGSGFEIRDGAGGTVLFSGYVGPNTLAVPVPVTMPFPLRQPTTNTALVVRQLAAGAVRVSATGYKGA